MPFCVPVCCLFMDFTSHHALLSLVFNLVQLCVITCLSLHLCVYIVLVFQLSGGYRCWMLWLAFSCLCFARLIWMLCCSVDLIKHYIHCIWIRFLFFPHLVSDCFLTTDELSLPEGTENSSTYEEVLDKIARSHLPEDIKTEVCDVLNEAHALAWAVDSWIENCQVLMKDFMLSATTNEDTEVSSPSTTENSMEDILDKVAVSQLPEDIRKNVWMVLYEALTIVTVLDSKLDNYRDLLQDLLPSATGSENTEVFRVLMKLSRMNALKEQIFDKMAVQLSQTEASHTPEYSETEECKSNNEGVCQDLDVASSGVFTPSDTVRDNEETEFACQSDELFTNSSTAENKEDRLRQVSTDDSELDFTSARFCYRPVNTGWDSEESESSSESELIFRTSLRSCSSENTEDRLRQLLTDDIEESESSSESELIFRTSLSSCSSENTEERLRQVSTDDRKQDDSTSGVHVPLDTDNTEISCQTDDLFRIKMSDSSDASMPSTSSMGFEEANNHLNIMPRVVIVRCTDDISSDDSEPDYPMPSTSGTGNVKSNSSYYLPVVIPVPSSSTETGWERRKRIRLTKKPNRLKSFFKRPWKALKCTFTCLCCTSKSQTLD